MKINWTLASVLVVWGLAAGEVAAAGLVISVGAAQGSPGQDVEVPIRIKQASDLGAIQVRFSSDPAVLEVKKVERGEAALQAAIMDSKFGPDGRAGMGFATTEAIAGDGVVFKVLVHVCGQVGQKCALKLDAARAWDEANTAEMLVGSENGEFTVVALQGGRLPAFPLWWIAAAVGGVLLLLLVVWGLRRSRHAEPAAAAAAGVIPTYGGEPTFKHHCSGCQKVIELPQSALGKQFKCAGCGAIQTGGS